MDLVTMILACSLYPDNSLVNAMVQVGSQNKPLAITVAEGPTKTFPTVQAAASYADTQIQSGKTVDIGLLQVPSFWLQQYPNSTNDLLMSCKNMVAATKILNDAVDQCNQMTNIVGDPEICALSYYKTHDAHAGTAYAQAVLAYANSHPFSVLESAAEAKNPAGFHMIPGDAPTTITTPNAAQLNPTTDKVKEPTSS